MFQIVFLSVIFFDVVDGFCGIFVEGRCNHLDEVFFECGWSLHGDLGSFGCFQFRIVTTAWTPAQQHSLYYRIYT